MTKQTFNATAVWDGTWWAVQIHVEHGNRDKLLMADVNADR